MNLKNTLKTLKLNESVISMILGAIVIIFAGILIVNYFSSKEGETIPSLEVGDELTLPTTHIIGEGEDLWNISERYYGNGYNWVEIAKENDIENPNFIEKDMEIVIPLLEEHFEVADAEIIIDEIEITPTLAPAGRTESKSLHTVQKGDDLWKIAEKFYDSGYNWVDIAKINNIKYAGKIEVGDELIIPAVEPRKRTLIDSKPQKVIVGATYTVQKGDNLWEISVRAFGDGYKWVEIAEENNLKDPDIIHTGNVFRLPR